MLKKSVSDRIRTGHAGPSPPHKEVFTMDSSDRSEAVAKQDGQKRKEERKRRKGARKDSPTYLAARPAIPEFQLLGMNVNRDRLDHPKEPSLTIQDNLMFRQLKPEPVEFELDQTI